MRTVRSLPVRATFTAALAVGLSALGLALVGAPTAVAAAPGAVCQRTFPSPVINVPIPDSGAGTASWTLDVPEDGLVVSDVNATLNIQHSFDGDLYVQLDSVTDSLQGRGRAALVNRVGGAGDNFTNTVLDDQAEDPVSWGVAPFTGRHQPTERLSALNGFSGGRYRLAVVDTNVSDVGTLLSWSITLTYASCDFDVDGVEDHKDGCTAIKASTPSGCPATTRTLRAAYSKGAFRGRLSSPVAGCKAGRPVTIWKAVAGPDRRVGTAKTRADGTFKLAKAKKRARYYATSPAAVVRNVAACPASKSGAFRVS